MYDKISVYIGSQGGQGGQGGQSGQSGQSGQTGTVMQPHCCGWLYKGLQGKMRGKVNNQ
jgi:hypothetical protein